MDWSKIKKIHFVGIKGVGMTPLAIIAKEGGFVISGSDVAEDFITKDALEKAGIKNITSFSPENVLGKDLLIVTAAHDGFENPEAVAASEKGIPAITQAEALGIFSKGEVFGKSFKTIAVSGSHGKTTTAAMIATILKNPLDPSYSVGTGDVPTLDGPGHLGKGKYFVCEADEYISFGAPKFFSLDPEIIVITNVDFDHPDVYKSIDDVRSKFLEFAQKLPIGGLLIACGDGAENEKFVTSFQGRKVTYGMNPNNDYFIDKISFKEGKTFFWVKYKDSYLGEFSIDIFGEQNALDALAAIIASQETGLSLDKIKEGIATYRGSKRRSELVGETKWGSLLYDDYAHHPQEISKTLESFKKNFPNSKIIPIFQPHMYSRTKLLFDDFVRAFDTADSVIITEIFPSFREKRDESFSAKLLSDVINKRVNGKSVFQSSLSDVVKYLDEKGIGKDSVLITMGAGDVYKIHKEMLN